MTSTVKAFKTRLLLSAGALLLFSASPALAGFGQNEDTSQIMSRINQLETQVQTLSRSVYRDGAGGAAPVAAPVAPVTTDGGDTGNLASFDARLSAVEEQQRRITGQLEQMQNDIQQMKDKVDKSSADNEMRFQQLQNGKGTGGSYTAPSAQAHGDDGDADTGSSLPKGSKVLGTMPAGATGSSGKTTPQGLYDDAFNDIRDQNYDSASAKFQTFLSQYPKDALAPNAQYWLAETYFAKQDYRQAAKIFAQNYQQYPQGSKAPASLLKLGMSLGRLGKKDDACLSYAQLKKEFPGDQTPEIKKASAEMAQLGCK